MTVKIWAIRIAQRMDNGIFEFFLFERGLASTLVPTADQVGNLFVVQFAFALKGSNQSKERVLSRRFGNHRWTDEFGLGGGWLQQLNDPGRQRSQWQIIRVMRGLPHVLTARLRMDARREHDLTVRRFNIQARSKQSCRIAELDLSKISEIIVLATAAGERLRGGGEHPVSLFQRRQRIVPTRFPIHIEDADSRSGTADQAEIGVRVLARDLIESSWIVGG